MIFFESHNQGLEPEGRKEEKRKEGEKGKERGLAERNVKAMLAWFPFPAVAPESPAHLRRNTCNISKL